MDNSNYEHLKESIPAKNNGENARQYAYRVLYNGIMSLDFPPGMVLMDAELSKLMNISRTPVREAILSLVTLKLVDIQPQRSSIVSRIDLDAIEEGVFVRFNIERAVVLRAASLANGQDISYLNENLTKQKESLESRRYDEFFALDNLFHKRLYIATHKPWTWDIMVGIMTHHDRVRRLQIRLGDSGRLWKSYEEHRTIYNSVISKNKDPMDDFLYDHLTAGYRTSLPELTRLYPDYFAI